MKRTLEEKLLNPRPGSKVAAAKEYGVDLTLLLRNLKLTPEERLIENQQAVNDLILMEECMKKSRQNN
jgi:hypothetical protein